jgi:FMN phosphatase YigB (HAD superfamily)
MSMLQGAAFADAASFAFVSLDIFDTALSRILAQPSDLWAAIGQRALAAGITTCTPDEFAIYREQAERVVRARVEALALDEPTMGEIHAELAAWGVVAHAQSSQDVEFATECAVCRPVPAVRAAFNTLSPPTRRIFISDSCWPADNLVAMLRHHGFSGDFRVFSSADFRHSKHTGRLFDDVVEALGCSPGQILHAGDNPVSDVARPAARGLVARHIPRPRPERAAPPADPAVRLALSHIRARAVNPDRAPAAQAAADGAKLADLATPLLIGFALFVLQQARARNVRRIYFLARDGHVPIGICRRLVAARGCQADFDLTYLHVSRAALQSDAEPLAYLGAAGFLEPGPIMIVDLGWRGSLQSRLSVLRGAEAGPIHGAYLGLWPEALRPGFGPPDAAGYLCSFGAPPGRAGVLREAYVVLELIFSAPEGSVIGYAKRACGGPVPILETETGPNVEARRHALEALEECCLDTVDSLTGLLAGAWPDRACPDEAFAPMRPLLEHPTHADVAMINRIPFIHGSGPLLPAVNPLPLREALLRPEASLRRLERAPWRAGAVRAALPWPLPGMSFQDLEHRYKKARRSFLKKRTEKLL